MQWYTKVGNLTTKMKVKIKISLLEFSVKKIVTWEYHVDESTQISNNMVFAIKQLTKLG